jgi:hypothetical protein
MCVCRWESKLSPSSSVIESWVHLTRFFNCVHYMPSNGRMNVKCELERIWEEADVACFKVMCHHMLEVTKGSHRKSSG